VSVGEYVRLDRDGFADHPFCGEATAINRGRDVIDHDTVRGNRMRRHFRSRQLHRVHGMRANDANFASVHQIGRPALAVENLVGNKRGTGRRRQRSKREAEFRWPLQIWVDNNHGGVLRVPNIGGVGSNKRRRLLSRIAKRSHRASDAELCQLLNKCVAVPDLSSKRTHAGQVYVTKVIGFAAPAAHVVLGAELKSHRDE
jgi:hypothetical protein